MCSTTVTRPSLQTAAGVWALLPCCCWYRQGIRGEGTTAACMAILARNLGTVHGQLFYDAHNVLHTNAHTALCLLACLDCIFPYTQMKEAHSARPICHHTCHTGNCWGSLLCKVCCGSSTGHQSLRTTASCSCSRAPLPEASSSIASAEHKLA